MLRVYDAQLILKPIINRSHLLMVPLCSDRKEQGVLSRFLGQLGFFTFKKRAVFPIIFGSLSIENALEPFLGRSSGIGDEPFFLDSRIAGLKSVLVTHAVIYKGHFK